MWNGNQYKDIFHDPVEGETEYEIGASKQADGTTQFTLFCPFDKTVSSANSKDQPTGIHCGKCGRDFPFPFPLGPW